MAQATDDRATALQRALETWLPGAAGALVTVTGLKPLVGGASQEAWALDVEVAGGPEAGRHALVLRRDMGGALSSSVLPRDREFAVQRAMHAAGLPIPRPYWYTPDLLGDGRAAFLMQRVEGETIGRRIVQDPKLAEARQILPEQMGTALATIHAVDPAAHDLGFLRAPAPGQSAADATLDRLEADLRAIDEPHPALELGLRWLRAHVPEEREPVLVHGDLRLGNLIVDEGGLVGVLDWEQCHAGDGAEDLGWMCLRSWRFGADDRPALGVGTREALLEAYAAAGGREVTLDELLFWEVLGNVRWGVICVIQAQRPTLEHYAIGRRACEPEWDLLGLMR